MLTKFIAGVAAIALAATALHSQPGGGQGGGQGAGQGASQGKGGGGGGPDQAKGGGNGSNKGSGDRSAGAQGPQSHGRENGKAKGPDERVSVPAANPNRQARGPEEREFRDNPGRPERGKINAKAIKKRENGRDDIRLGGNDARVTRSSSRVPFRWAELNRRDLVQGCPPGLAKKNNGCTPPGLAKSRSADWREVYDRPDWWGYDDYQGRYSYYDGRLLQLGSNGSILGYLPLLGGALAPGNVWPSFYEPVDVPDYYQSYYNLGSDDSYRYYDDAFYAVDPQSQAISAIAALLTGDDFAVGQAQPDGYDVYNVPYSYRDEYVDGPEAAYRYSDGYVYEVDPTTQLIRTVIELLT